MLAPPSRRRRVAAVVLAGALFASLGCSSSDPAEATPGSTDASDAQPTTTAGGGASSSETSESGDPTVAPPPDTVASPTAYADTARDAVNELRAAWETGDADRARRIAPAEVVVALFAVPAASFETYGCDTGEFPTSTCNYRNRSTGVFIKVSAARSDAGWQISTITVA